MRVARMRMDNRVTESMSSHSINPQKILTMISKNNLTTDKLLIIFVTFLSF